MSGLPLALLVLLYGCDSPPASSPQYVPSPAGQSEGQQPRSGHDPGVPKAPPPAEVAQFEPAPPDPTRALSWPLHRLVGPPPGASAALPIGATVLDVDLAPSGASATVLWQTPSGPPTLSRWAYTSSPRAVPVALPDGEELIEIAWAHQTADAFGLTAGADGAHRLRRWAAEETGLTGGALVYESTAPLADLVAPLGRWDGRDRLFFTRVDPHGAQVLSVTGDGTRPYELTSVTGEFTDLTDAETAGILDSHRPVRTTSARLLDLMSDGGHLLWADGKGAVHQRDYADTEWAEDRRMPGLDGATSVAQAAGSPLLLRWTDGQPGVVLGAGVAPPRGPEQSQAVDALFIRPPLLSADGRTIIGITAGPKIEAHPVTHPLATWRHTSHANLSTEEQTAVMTQGISVRSTRTQQMWDLHDQWVYDLPDTPRIATIDGMVEVLHTGFQAVFLRVERDRSAPALDTFLRELARAAKATEMTDVVTFAHAARNVLAGDYDHPEGQRILAEQSAQSDVVGHKVDYADFKPRGPYAQEPTLAAYFRAFKLTNQLQLSRHDQSILAGDAKLIAAWTAWTATQSDFLSGSRVPALFDTSHRRPSHVPSGCVPERVREQPARPFPLSWGIDSEVLESSVSRIGVDPSCAVPGRLAPTGLDLLAGMGSPRARGLLAAEYAQWQGLESHHEALAKRLGSPLKGTGFVRDWLRLVQILSSPDDHPTGVAPDAWRTRGLESGLAAWTSFRHTTVLVNERGGAEAGEGFDSFEYFERPPSPHFADPLPRAWDSLAGLFDQLAAHSTGADRVAEVLTEAADTSRRYSDMASRQQRGEPLTSDEYRELGAFAGTIEHPILLLKTSTRPDGALSVSEDTARIVDIQEWADADDNQHIWHAAVGRPRSTVMLLDDRGVHVPARGVLHSFHEIDSPVPLSDAEWRKQVDDAPPVAWSLAAPATP